MIYVTGDTHGRYDVAKLNSGSFPDNKILTKDDFVIVAGDFGFIWDGKNEDKFWLRWFEKKNFTTLFVDGNHENFDLLNSYPIETWCGGKVHKINDSVIHLMRGQVFQIHNLKIFTFGGAKSKDIEHRKENVSWWQEEMPSKAEYDEGLLNLEKYRWSVDYIVTHTCPALVVNQVSNLCGTKVDCDEITNYLDFIEKAVSYKHWYFGHYHKDIQVTDNITLIFNEVKPLK